MKTVRRPPYPKWNPGYFPCSSLTPLPLSSRRPSVSFGGFGVRGVIGLMVKVQNVLHVVDEMMVSLRWNHPTLDTPRLEFVFFNTRRTVSYETDSTSTCSKVTSRSDNNRRLQWLRPSGGGLHAKAIKCASAVPSSLRSYSLFGGRRLRAACSPSFAKRRRTRAIVGILTSKASWIDLSVQRSSAFSRTLA